MPEFPKREADIVCLAQSVVSGIKQHPEVFTDPPTPLDVIEPMLDEYREARDELRNAKAAFQAAMKRKNMALKSVTFNVKRELKYANRLARENPNILQLLGWHKRKPNTPNPPPNAPQDVRVVPNETPGLVKLQWKRPFKATRKNIKYYLIQRREWSAENGMTSWRDIAVSMKRFVDLERQPCRVKLEYRVRAINVRGEGPYSNVVSTVV